MREPLLTMVLLAAASGCAGDDGAPRAGGEASIDDRSSDAFSFPAPNLTAEELERHFAGDVAFEAVFVSPPAPVNAGLGPVFNHTSCAGCHLRDGRGMPVAGDPRLGSHLIVRISVSAGESVMPRGPVPVPGLGSQLQDHSVFGQLPEASVAISWIEQEGSYGDGEPYSLRRPLLDIRTSDGQPLSPDVMVSPRIPAPVFGVGLLEAVPADGLLAMTDPEDADGDGISGRVNTVYDADRDDMTIGRFGWKAGAPNLRQQTAGAYAEDMGVSSPMFPEADGVSDIDDRTVDLATFYVQTLAVPLRRGWDDPEVRRGEQLFGAAGCHACHVDTLQTGEHDIPAISGQTIHPYTDLLLHDTGPGLADFRHEFDAWDQEWRTPPLWGIGLTHTVLPYSSFLHDGRARTLEEAILWHGGEAEESKERFRIMPVDDRRALIRFLRSL